MQWNREPEPVLKGGERRARRVFAWKRTPVGDKIVWLERYEVHERYFAPAGGGPGWWSESSMTDQVDNTHNPTPATEPLALRLSEGLGPVVEVRGMLANGVQIPLAVRGVYALRDGKTGVYVTMPDADDARAPLTDEQMRDLVKECGLDWQRGYMPLFDGDPTNRYAVLIEAVERVIKGDKP